MIQLYRYPPPPFYFSLNFPSDKKHSTHTRSDNTSTVALPFPASLCFELGSRSWGHFIPWLEKNERINLTSAGILSVLPAGREALFRYCCLLLALGYCSKAVSVNLCALSASVSGRYHVLLHRCGETQGQRQPGGYGAKCCACLAGVLFNGNCRFALGFYVKQSS